MAKKMNFVTAINLAMHDAMEQDENVIPGEMRGICI